MSAQHKFIAYGQKGLRMSSPDGRKWSEPVLEKNKYYFKGCAVVPDKDGAKFVAFATSGGKVAFFSSPDGNAWEKVTELEVGQTAGRLHDIVYGGGQFLVIGGDMDGRWTSVMTSPDGLTWKGPKKFDKEPLLMRVTYGNGQFVAAGVRGRVAVSKDGQKWKDAEPLMPLDTFIDVAYGAGVYVGAGLHGLRMFSTDGLKWEGRQVGEEGEHINNMLFTGKQFVGVGLGATFLSDDGRKWTREKNTNPPTASTYGGGAFVGSRWRGRILYSQDAITWEEVLRAPEHVTGVFYPAG